MNTRDRGGERGERKNEYEGYGWREGGEKE